MVHQEDTITIAIQRHAKISLFVDDALLQLLRMGGADTVIDIDPIRLDSNRDDLGAKLVQNFGSNLVSRTMRAINHDF